MNHKKLRVAAYCRVSTDKDDQTNSLLSQRKYFTEYITRHEDWILQDVYYDEGISGTQTKKRIGFNTMIEEALRGGIDLILTKEVCRFARNTVDTLHYTRLLKDKGIGVIFTIDNIDTRDADVELRLTIMASIAQEESRKTSERVKWGQKRRMEQGVVFGRDMIGYTVRNGELTVNEAEVSLVRAVFHKYTNEGKGTHVIARELMEEGLRPPRVKLWSNTVILRMLRNEKYVGDLCQKKTYTPNYLTHAKKYNRGAEEMVYIKGHHEPIIDRELWNRTQAELKRRSPSEAIKTKHSNRYWCSGKLCCGACGHHFVSRTKKLADGSTYKAWRCYAFANHGTAKTMDTGEAVGCSNGSINERALLSCVHHCIRQFQANRKALKQELLQELTGAKSVNDTGIDVSGIHEKLEALNTKKRKAVDLMLDGLISKVELQEQTKWYDDQIEKLNKLLQGVQKEDDMRSRQLNLFRQYNSVLDEIMTFDESNLGLYRELVEKITVYPGSVVEIWFREIPFGMKLKIRSHGRAEDYTTEILETEILTQPTENSIYAPEAS
ncbi:MAG: recombinase family protein [Lachnospiraceae bacterium]|nr:recombinase family protein [Lachnospiraceae bacterium]